MDIDADRKELGRRLQAARIAAKGGRVFTQAEVGLALDRGAKAVSAWEAGRGLPDALALRWMAKHYGVSADELLGLDRTDNADAFWHECAREVADIGGSYELTARKWLAAVDSLAGFGPDDDTERKAFIRGLLQAMASSHA